MAASGEVVLPGVCGGFGGEMEGAGGPSAGRDGGIAANGGVRSEGVGFREGK